MPGRIKPNLVRKDSVKAPLSPPPSADTRRFQWEINDEMGYFQLGKPEPNDDLYIVNITLICVRHLEKLIQSPPKDLQWMIEFEAYGMLIHSSPFCLQGDNEKKPTYLGDQSTARIRANDEEFTRYLRETALEIKVKLILGEKEEVVGAGGIALERLTAKDNNEIRGAVEIVPQHGKLLSRDSRPSLTYAVEVQKSLKITVENFEDEDIDIGEEETKSEGDLGNLNAVVAELQDKLQEKEATVTSLQEEMDSLYRFQMELLAKQAKDSKKIQQRDTTIESLNKCIQKQEKMFALGKSYEEAKELRKSLEVARAEILDLSQQLKDVRSSSEQFQSYVAQEFEVKESEMQALNAQVVEANNKVGIHDKELSSLRKSIAQSSNAYENERQSWAETLARLEKKVHTLEKAMDSRIEMDQQSKAEIEKFSSKLENLQSQVHIGKIQETHKQKKMPGPGRKSHLFTQLQDDPTKSITSNSTTATVTKRSSTLAQTGTTKNARQTELKTYSRIHKHARPADPKDDFRHDEASTGSSSSPSSASPTPSPERIKSLRELLGDSDDESWLSLSPPFQDSFHRSPTEKTKSKSQEDRPSLRRFWPRPKKTCSQTDTRFF